MHRSLLSLKPLAGPAPALAIALSLLAAGCGGPTADDVRARTSAILAPAITDTAQVLDELADHKVVAMLSRWIGERFDDDVLIHRDPVAGEGSASSAYPETDPDALCGVDQPAPPRERLAPQAAELAREIDEFLAQRIFNEANVESSSGGKTTFLIKGDLFCGTTRVVQAPTPVLPSGGSGGGMPGDDAIYDEETAEPVVGSSTDGNGCREVLAKLAIRIDASLVDDGVDLGIRIGDADGALVVIELRPASITVKGLLPALLEGGKHFAAITGEQLPDGFPTALQGVISAALKRGEGGARSAELAILEALAVAGSVEGEDYRAAIPAATPVARLSYQDGELQLDASWGVTELLLPGNALLSKELRRPLDRALEVLFSGIKATIRATRDGELRIDELTFGERPSRLTFGGETLLGVDVNPDHGHTMAATLSPFDAQLPECSVDPALDVRVEVHGNKLAAYLEDEVPTWAADERYRLLIAAANGAGPVVVPLFIDAHAVATCASGGMYDRDGSDAGGDAPTPVDPPPDAEPVPEDLFPAPAPEPLVRVVAGALTLQSFVHPQQVVVSAGSCLVAEQGAEPSTLPLGGLAAGSCE